MHKYVSDGVGGCKGGSPRLYFPCCAGLGARRSARRCFHNLTHTHIVIHYSSSVLFLSSVPVILYILKPESLGTRGFLNQMGDFKTCRAGMGKALPAAA